MKIDHRKLADSPEMLATGSCPLFLSVILPVYNEEAAIEQVIVEHVEVLATLRELIAEWEIVCVDDASSDRTLSILKRLSSRVSGLVVVRHVESRGIYQSFADGFAAARGTHFYATGADGQWPATNLPEMLGGVVAGGRSCGRSEAEQESGLRCEETLCVLCIQRVDASSVWRQYA